MNKDKYVFSQLTSLLDRSLFNDYIPKYHGDKYVKYFTCWDQLLVLMFGRLSNRESLRDLIVALEGHRGKFYFLGMGKHITGSNLTKANESKDCQIFKDFSYRMIDETIRKKCTDIFKIEATFMRST